MRKLLAQTLFGSQELRPGELRSASWSAVMLGIALGAWYFIRPVRDEIASHQNAVLTGMTTATFIVMLGAMPLYAWIVKRSTRRRLVPGVYWFFALTLAGFCAALKGASTSASVWIERAFFVWASVFNLFLVSVLWALFVDVFTEPQGKRLFGFIAAGGSLGGLIGSGAASLVLAPPIRLSSAPMLLIAAGVLAISPICMLGILTTESRSRDADVLRADRPIRGSVWNALAAPFRSPYLLGICAYLFLYSLSSTFLFFERSQIFETATADRALRKVWLARMDTVVNVVTLLAQLFVASRAMLALGVAFTLCVTPLLTLGGFVVLAAAPVLRVVIAFEVLRRISNFALARPAREVLFTIVPREDKYKAKTFIDTVIYRGGDTLSAWTFSGLQALGLGLAGLSAVAAVISGGWFSVGWALGRAHRRATSNNESASHLVP